MIQGEFIDDSKMEELKFEKFIEKEIDGIRVFVPQHKLLENKKEINIRPGITLFGKMFYLKVTTDE